MKRIFFDLDGTLIFTELELNRKRDMCFKLGRGKQWYSTDIRPSAHELIEFARDIVGPENVWVLTIASGDYARTINSMASFGFTDEQIVSREIIQDHRVKGAYGAVYTQVMESISDSENFLIDDLPSRENESKLGILGIRNLENYLKISEFFGKPQFNTGVSQQEFLAKYEHDFTASVKTFLTNKVK
jgi:hypothetical protein